MWKKEHSFTHQSSLEDNPGYFAVARVWLLDFWVRSRSRHPGVVSVFADDPDNLKA